MFPPRRNTRCQAFADALRRAISYLAIEESKILVPGTSTFICGALMLLGDEPQALFHEIEDRIYPSQTYRNWLKTHHSVLHETLTFKDVQELRRAWMFEMIEEFSTKEKSHVS